MSKAKAVPAPKQDSPKKHFTIQEAAVYLACHVYALRTAVWRKELPAAKIGHRLVFDRADLDAWFNRLKLA